MTEAKSHITVLPKKLGRLAIVFLSSAASVFGLLIWTIMLLFGEFNFDAFSYGAPRAFAVVIVTTMLGVIVNDWGWITRIIFGLAVGLAFSFLYIWFVLGHQSHDIDFSTIGPITIVVDDKPNYEVVRGDPGFEKIAMWLEQNRGGWSIYAVTAPDTTMFFVSDSFHMIIGDDWVILQEHGGNQLIMDVSPSELELFRELSDGR